jgi:CRISPR-associated protein Csb2
MGVALALPRNFSADDRRALVDALARVNHLALGKLGTWRLATPGTPRPPTTLIARTWTAAPHGAREWATVTPFVSDRHAKAKEPAAYREEIAVDIRAACARVGIDVPVQVVVTPVSAHLGVPPAHRFPRMTRKDGSERQHTHAILIFQEPVVGPILLGAGRYRGYGLCRPLES